MKILVVLLVSLTLGLAPAPFPRRSNSNSYPLNIEGSWTIVIGHDLPHEDKVYDQHYVFYKDGTCKWWGLGDWEWGLGSWKIRNSKLYVITKDIHGFAGTEIWELKREDDILVGSCYWEGEHPKLYHKVTWFRPSALPKGTRKAP